MGWDIVFPMLIYADKYVSKYGINHCQLFNLLLTRYEDFPPIHSVNYVYRVYIHITHLFNLISMIVTVKFWDDTSRISNAAIAKTFNYKLKDVNLMEKWFLSGLEYKLSMTDMDIYSFISNCIIRCFWTTYDVNNFNSTINALIMLL